MKVAKGRGNTLKGKELVPQEINMGEKGPIPFHKRSRKVVGGKGSNRGRRGAVRIAENKLHKRCRSGKNLHGFLGKSIAIGKGKGRKSAAPRIKHKTEKIGLRTSQKRVISLQKKRCWQLGKEGSPPANCC